MAAAPRSRSGADASVRWKRRPVRLADARDAPFASPALETQAMLADIWRREAALNEISEKWSPRRTAAFLLLTCGGFWAAVGFGVLRAFR